MAEEEVTPEELEELEESLSEEDIKDLKKNPPSCPPFPVLMFILALGKDFVDWLDGGIGVFALAASFIFWPIFLIWIIRREMPILHYLPNVLFNVNTMMFLVAAIFAEGSPFFSAIPTCVILIWRIRVVEKRVYRILNPKIIDKLMMKVVGKIG